MIGCSGNDNGQQMREYNVRTTGMSVREIMRDMKKLRGTTKKRMSGKQCGDFCSKHLTNDHD